MSSDMMIICKEDDSGSMGKNYEKAFFVDECSMGEPWSQFGKWFQERYCGAPGMIQQLHGIKEHSWIELTLADRIAIEMMVDSSSCHKDTKKKDLLKYVDEHIGKHVSTENW